MGSNPAGDALCFAGRTRSWAFTGTSRSRSRDARVPLFAFGDVHLSAGSPAIDSGTRTGAPVTDFEGDPRPTGGGCDMGADEFVP